MIKTFLIIGFGGFLGSIARFSLGNYLTRFFDQTQFPVGTFAVNILGCFVIGLIGGLIESRDLFSPEVRLMLLVGVLGGFTTFSSFGNESLFLFQQGEMRTVLLYVGMSVFCGLLAVWMGSRIAFSLYT